MNDYILGCTVLGADVPVNVSVPAAVLTPQQFAEAFNKGIAPFNAANQQQIENARIARMKTAMLIGGVVGSVVGAGGGAALWAAHRFWGFFFGAMLAAPLGVGIGAAAAAAKESL